METEAIPNGKSMHDTALFPYLNNFLVCTYCAWIFIYTSCFLWGSSAWCV